jgi:hypothetical protein
VKKLSSREIHNQPSSWNFDRPLDAGVVPIGQMGSEGVRLIYPESPRACASDGCKRDVERVPHGDAPTPRLEGGKIITKKNKKQRGIFSEVFIF